MTDRTLSLHNQISFYIIILSGFLSLKLDCLSNFKLPIEAYLTDYKVDFELTDRTLKLYYITLNYVSYNQVSVAFTL